MSLCDGRCRDGHAGVAPERAGPGATLTARTGFPAKSPRACSAETEEPAAAIGSSPETRGDGEAWGRGDVFSLEGSRRCRTAETPTGRTASKPTKATGREADHDCAIRPAPVHQPPFAVRTAEVRSASRIVGLAAALAPGLDHGTGGEDDSSVAWSRACHVGWRFDLLIGWPVVPSPLGCADVPGIDSPQLRCGRDPRTKRLAWCLLCVRGNRGRLWRDGHLPVILERRARSQENLTAASGGRHGPPPH